MRNTVATEWTQLRGHVFLYTGRLYLILLLCFIIVPDVFQQCYFVASDCKLSVSL